MILSPFTRVTNFRKLLEGRVPQPIIYCTQRRRLVSLFLRLSRSCLGPEKVNTVKTVCAVRLCSGSVPSEWHVISQL